MSQAYDHYLSTHKKNVLTGYYWIKDNLPEIVSKYPDTIELDEQMRNHDASKSNRDEYHAYDAYFYGHNKSHAVVKDFDRAWLLHIHRNPHHWQYWILVRDDLTEDALLEMPYNYILEMICDWWTFSWEQENLYEIFDWYEEHKDHIRLESHTRKTVEDILDKIRTKLEEIDKEEGDENG